MPSVVKCILEIEKRCHAKGNVITMPVEYLLAIKSHLVLFKEVCEILPPEILSLFDYEDQADINLTAKEDYNEA